MQLLTKLVFRRTIRRAALGAIVGRNRQPADPEKGRFTVGDVDQILHDTWRVYDQRASTVPREPKLGNRMNMMLACLTLSCLAVMLDSGIKRKYAIELIGDTAWKVYEVWGRVPKRTVNLVVRDPRLRMRLCVNLFLRFPFTPPGYVFERKPTPEGIAVDMLRCPVSDYLLQNDAADLCQGTWCNLDFALAEMWGSRLCREETLSAGCPRCDFRFETIGPKKP